MKHSLLIFLLCIINLVGCVSSTYSPMYVDYPKISIADITASYNKVTVTITPLNASSIAYAIVRDGEGEPSPDNWLSMEVDGEDCNITIENLEATTSYRIYAYAVSGVYENEVSQTVSSSFATAELQTLNVTDETANCYMLPDAGCYKFDATVKGCSNIPVEGAVSAEVIWSDVAGMLGNVELLQDGWVTFVAKQNTGNCVLAVKDKDGSILWSWHIWGPGDIPSDDIIMNKAGTVYHVMSRNLGAFSSTSGSTCVLYQWGRKDPFSNGHYIYVGNKTTTDRHITYWPPVKWDETGDEQNNNISYTIENPAVFIDNADNESGNWTWTDDWSLWGDRNGYSASYASGGWSGSKSIYDPCPPGYRVANVNTFSGLSLDSAIGEWSNGYWFRRTGTDAIGTWFPATSSRDPSHGGVVRGALCELWCSNPSGSNATAKARLFSAFDGTVSPAITAVAAYGHTVRCVRYSETDNNNH